MMQILAFLTLAIVLTACTPLQPIKKQAFIFMPGYKPQASLPFVGAYVAKEKGFFEALGLDVTIQHSPGKGEHLQMVSTGKVQVTTQDAAIMLMRRAEPGLPLVSFALIGQRGQQAYAALASSGLKTPKDWEGHTVGYKGTPPPDLLALLHAAGADEKKVRLVNVGFDPRLLTEGKVDVYPVYKSNEPYLIEQWGYELTLWNVEDYGVPSLGLTYVTGEETLKNQPEALTLFLRAALQGIDYADKHRDEAVAIVMKYAGPETDAGNMRFMLDSELADAHSEVADEFGIGWQTNAQWQAMADMLEKYQSMPAVDVDEAFTTKILEAAQKP